MAAPTCVTAAARLAGKALKAEALRGLALLALLLYPVVWILLLPFRLVGIVVDGVFETLRAVVLLPARVLGSRR